MKKEGSAAFASMNAALQRQCNAIQKLLAEAALGEIDTRYKVGVLIRSIAEGESTYGESAVERVAKALRRDRTTLYRYAAVAKLWSGVELRELARRTNAHGESLSWSHWMELTRAPKTWRLWLERALEGSWSVRELSRELDGEHAEEDGTKAEDTTLTALIDTVRDAERMNAAMTSFSAILDRLARSPRRPPEVEELLRRVRASLHAVARKSGDLLARVDRLAQQNGSPNGVARGVEMEN